MKTINDFFEQEMKGLNQSLDGLSGNHSTPLIRMREEMALIRGAIQRLEKLQPASVAEEIEFHKILYPQIRAMHIYRVEFFLLEKDLPDDADTYYRERLEQIKNFFRRHSFVYSYYQLDATDLDDLYFTASGKDSVLLPVLSDPETCYTTAAGYLFARFRALEKLAQEIKRRLNGEEVKPVALLRWTGSLVNLVELIYGLYYTGQFNNGNAEVKQIAAVMEQVFSIKLGDTHHAFGEIRERKVASPSRFLELMAKAIQQRVDEDLNYKPGRK